MQVQLSWEDPASQEQQQESFDLPLAIGKQERNIPNTLDSGESLSKVILVSKEISRYHALIRWVDGQLMLTDRSTNGTFVNGELLQQSTQPIKNGDTLQIGPYQILITVLPDSEATEVVRPASTIYEPQTNIVEPSVSSTASAAHESTIIFDPETDLPKPEASSSSQETTSLSAFPPPEFLEPEKVSLQALQATGDPIETYDYVALGGGLGSFAWVDHLRIHGVTPDRIAVISLENKPYGRYQRLCNNSQIPAHERLRSGSDSCPDNLWGWPGYAWREAWRDILSGQLASAAQHLWQVFAEPVLVETYTPKSGNVFDSFDREAERIGWSRMLKIGQIRSIRKTEDGRYAIAYSVPRKAQRDHRYLIASYVHLSTGYPAIRFLPDLQEYRASTGDFQSVVNAYESHDHVYESLERNGGTVIVRGRGIVASRILQRINEVRQKNSSIKIINLMRSPIASGHKFGPAQRPVENHWEFQPYNWPKATWGGDMRMMLESASPERRYELLKDWGGTTTASRKDWRNLISQGLKEGWYAINFGKVEQVQPTDDGKLLSYLQTHQGELKVEADFIIDATGLEANPKGSPLLNDLMTHYDLPLNPYGRLHVANDFELVKMRNDRARMYAAGVLTLGGPYAPVDTFLGLQYAAQRSVEGLVRARAPKVCYLSPLRSLWQWKKWIFNQEP